MDDGKTQLHKEAYIYNNKNKTIWQNKKDSIHILKM